MARTTRASERTSELSLMRLRMSSSRGSLKITGTSDSYHCSVDVSGKHNERKRKEKGLRDLSLWDSKRILVNIVGTYSYSYVLATQVRSQAHTLDGGGI
ncbi:hypothetical protein MPTK1_4g07580 [Marchantia polymorpha subsp. ruderalis]|uniref:Uncharacterized protein n=2 Tax=Marchantia polymorpha TaxID=3197 RepID=A0AAF6B7H0_MARPO|nr:hypothetical protein MARPO_0115s0023 [Marchantia polymorpha]BBN07954.1 hypothetical protein Mp_4g07580 [Marchantia polymorpha subsp. ruderalis]|eukprot:PTQ31100.1 hypothetical protein MARPO_0115s0023 [Marchantia polymorpha]